MTKAGESILRGAREALAYARGEGGGCVAYVPEAVDVRAIRRRLGLSQAGFAARYGFALDAVRDWEQGRRQPDTAARLPDGDRARTRGRRAGAVGAVRRRAADAAAGGRAGSGLRRRAGRPGGGRRALVDAYGRGKHVRARR